MKHTALSIDRAVVDAILARRIRAGIRKGEPALATLFRVSRLATKLSTSPPTSRLGISIPPQP